MGKRFGTQEQWRLMITEAMSEMMADVANGGSIRKTIDRYNIGDHIFYKYATLEQKSQLRKLRMPSATVPTYDPNSYTPPKVIILRQDRINYILNGVCSYYNLPLDLLRAQSRGRVGKRRKMMTIKLLRDLADISFKEIKYAFNNKSEQSIWASYTAISEDINYGGNNSTKKEYEEILKSMNL